MSQQQVRSLRTLIAVRKRQQERLEATLAEQRRTLDERQQQEQLARDELQRCLARERDSEVERDTLLSAGFQPTKLIQLEHHLQTLRGDTALATKDLQKCEQAVVQQQEVIAGVQREIRRNAQRGDRFREQVKVILSLRELALEEVGEEETEETSTARFCARQRAAKENHDGV
jgi:Bacterial type III secretion protein (HrpB7)